MTMSLPLAWTAVANAQPLPDYGFDWVTVGNPGNANATRDQFPFLYRDGGGVDTAYRITTLPASMRQWSEFATAFDAVATQAERLTLQFSSIYVQRQGQSGPLVFYPQYNDYPATSNFMLAMRYANWLHNDRATGRAAFDDGAYDMSEFYEVSPNVWRGNAVRRPDAKIWIPSHDELVKSFYYDPDRYGPDEGGYWAYPHGSDEQPIYGAPWEPDAQSNAGIELPLGDWVFNMPLGLYPDTASPYGVLEASGGIAEWTETPLWGIDIGDRYFHQSAAGGHHSPFDALNRAFQAAPIHLGLSGFRFAAVVPSPGAVPVLAFAAFVTFARRKR
ncbi:MAG: hypothetical protein JJU33_07270 [Phycisphaerales bacterium]|nr:hypothetical protein [Phycisphaerales bacterium]